ncbi:MAG: metallophosphoesterase [Lentisphaeria bacterium]|nr:metallophosphoesterase [Lentisphaeria bacterium]
MMGNFMAEEAFSPTKVFSLQKSADRDFVVLNISDPQLSPADWCAGSPYRKILIRTMEELVARVKPDLITISGDLAAPGCGTACETLASYLDTFRIPWAPVWGNHDNQAGKEYIRSVGENFQKKHPFCLFDAGDPRLGNGNYIIGIQEGEKKIAALVMMDSHDRDPYPTPEKPDNQCWARLWPIQYEWYCAQADALKASGYRDSAIVMHIPIFAYQQAFAAAFKEGLDPHAVTFQQSLEGGCWNSGYEKSIGVCHEGICSYPEEDDAFAAFKKKDFTTCIISGHDHVNNFIVDYQGVKLVYSVKTGAGCYWEPASNGGTVLTIGEEGIKGVRQEFVEVGDLVPLLPKE